MFTVRKVCKTYYNVYITHTVPCYNRVILPSSIYQCLIYHCVKTFKNKSVLLKLVVSVVLDPRERVWQHYCLSDIKNVFSLR